MKKIIAMLLMVSFMVGCGIKDNQKNGNKSTEEMYEQYKVITSSVEKNFKFSNYEMKETTTKIDNIRIIERDVSFDKKELLTVTGTMDSGETQDKLVYVSDRKYIEVDVIFSEINIGNQILYYDSVSEILIDNKMIKNYRELMFSYKNVIFKVRFISNDLEDSDIIELNTFTAELEKYLVENCE